MTRRQRLYSVVVGIFGITGSSVALLAFFLKIRSNGLVIPDLPARQAVYLSVGSAYSGGFMAGFSLCFFLMLLAVAVGTWYDARRA